MPEEKKGQPLGQPGTGELVVEKRPALKRPPMFRVVLLNDDYTPMEFVVWVLQMVFHKAPDEAARLMLDVHNKGKGLCGTFTHDVARTKAIQVEALAKREEHPLKCEIEACG